MTTPYPGDPDPYGAGPDPYGGGPGDLWGDQPPDGPGWTGNGWTGNGWAGGPPSGPWPPGEGPPEPPPGSRRGPVALVVVGAVVVLGLVAAAALVALTRSDDPQDAGTGPLSEPEEEWSIDLGSEVDDEMGGDLVLLSDGDVVLLAWSGPYDAEADESGGLEIRAFSAGDGELLWDDHIDGESYTSPISLLGHGRLLVTEGFDDRAVTRLLDARTGDEIWEAQGMANSAVWTGPFDVQIGTWPSDRLLLDSTDGDGETRDAVMVDLDNGEELWTERNADALDCGDGVITIDNSHETDTGFDELDPDDVEVVGRTGRSGDEIWTLQGFPGPCSDGVVAVATQDDELVLVKVSSGRRSDPIDLGQGADYTSATAFGDHVVVNQFDDDDDRGRSAIYPIRGGEPTWEDQVGYAFPLGDELVLVTDVEGDGASVVRAADGEELDDVEVPGYDGSCEGALAPRTSLVCDDPSEITSYALVGEAGERWTVDLDGEVLALAIGGERMFAVVDDQLVSYR